MRIVSFAVVWGLMTGWEPASWAVGAPAVVLAAWLSTTLRAEGAGPVSLPGLARLFPFFVWQSLRAGLDTAVRAFGGIRHIDPFLCRVPARLSDSRARVLAATVTSLLPGTLAVDIDGDDYVIHALTGSEATVAADLGDVESRVAPVFGMRLTREARP